jgi:hypothetical protein
MVSEEGVAVVVVIVRVYTEEEGKKIVTTMANMKLRSDVSSPNTRYYYCIFDDYILKLRLIHACKRRVELNP